MYKYSDVEARRIALSLVQRAIDAGFMSNASNGKVAGEHIVAMMEAITTGLSNSNESKDD